MTKESSPTLAVMRAARVALTLDNWLSFNGVTDGDEPHPELLEVVPAMFREEYAGRIRLWHEYEEKFASKQEEPCQTSPSR